MSPVARWTRRTLLGLLGAAGLGVAIRRWPLLATPRGDAGVAPELGALAGTRGAMVVGTAYLRLHPEEANEADLRRLLGLGDSSSPDDPGRSERAALAARHREDFLAGRVVRIDGWILSATELRLAALSMTRGTP